ncbi:unnamed protein product, partial [Ixodes hexagonus]
MLPHRIVGFSNALDWRPLLFVEPVIAERACALCGVVCREAVRLCCAHTLCSECHAACALQGGTCPLDEEPFCEDDLDRLECSAGYLGKHWVACCNAPTGCNYVGPVSSLLEHFKQCGFHSVSCPRCHSSVARSNIVKHCKDGCSLPPTTGTLDNNRLGRDRDRTREACNELREALRKIPEDLKLLQCSLYQCCDGIRATDASWKQMLEDQACRLAGLHALCTAGFTEELRALQSIAVDVNTTVTTVGSSIRELVVKELCAQSDQLIAVTQGVPQKLLRFCGPRTYLWHASDWSAMKSRALEGRTALSESPMWNAFGYSVGLCLELAKSRKQRLRVNCFFRVHRGSYDTELEWPFRKSFAFGVVHPRDRS